MHFVLLHEIRNLYYIQSTLKNLLTTEQLRLKYDPESILKDIDANYEKYLEKLKGWIFQEDNPINNYNTVQQISFLETNDQKDTNLNKIFSFSE